MPTGLVRVNESSNQIIITTNINNTINIRTDTSNGNLIIVTNGTNTVHYLNSNSTSTNFINTYSTSSAYLIPTSSTTITGNWYVTGSTFTGNVKPKLPYIKKSTRNSIKRALKLLDDFGMSDDIRVFMSGGSIEISHPDSHLKFVIRKQSYKNIIHATENPSYSTPYILELYTKTDIYIAKLCVFLKNTPIFDQILAVSTFIKTGCEDEILKKANFFSVSNDEEIKHTLRQEIPLLSRKLN